MWARVEEASSVDVGVMDAHRCCRFKRKVFVLTAMLSGLMCFMLYTLSFSCCAVVDSARLHHRTQGSAGALYYGTDTEDGGQRGNNNNRHHRLREAHPSNRFMHKSLLEDSRHSERTREYSDSGLPHSPLQNNHKNNNNRLNFEGGEDSNNYVVEDDQDSDNSHHEYDTEEGYVNKNRRKIEITKSLPTGTKKLPTALIIGVKKGGTRALLEFIRVHPDVRAPGPEIHFFDRHFHRGIDWYRNQMPPTIKGQITMEKTPSYFVTKEVPRRIYNMSKDMKVIVVVRDPVTRAISDYTQTSCKRPNMKPFEGMAFLNNSSRVVDTSWGAIRIGVYAKHLERWLRYFSLNQMLFVSGERLISDPAGVMAQVQDFLGLKRVISEKHFFFNETKGFPCLKKPEGSGSPHCLGKTKGRMHPKIDPTVLQRLRDFYRPFNAKFYQMTNQDFGWP